MEKSSVRIAPIVHTIIGLAIMVSGYFLPCLSMVVEPTEKLMALNLPQVAGGLELSITRIGMIVSTTFFGVVYLWTFVDVLWPCFAGLAALIFSGYAPAPKVLSQFLGNPMVVMIFFLLMLAAAIIYCDIAGWVARWAMTRKFVNGRPWVLTATILVTTYFVAFLDQTASMFLMWPAMFSIFKETGYKKGDMYVSLMTVYIAIVILCSFASDPFKGGAMYLLVNLQSLAANDVTANVPQINLALYLFFGMTISFVVIALLLFMMRFVFRADVSRLASYKVDTEEVPPMTTMQKLVLFDFLFYAAWLLIPAFIGHDNALGSFLHKNHLTGSLITVLILSIAFVKGKRVISVPQANSKYPWVVFLLIAVAMLLGAVMTGKGTNVSLYMEYTLRSLLNGMHPIAFTITVAAIGIIFTNFCNSVVLGLMLTPVLLAVASAFGMDPVPMMACFIFAVLIAACTPAASPFAATLFSQQEWVSTKDIALHAVIGSAIVFLVICVVGLPLANLIL